ncbi:GAF and ANTAR domain-containing protein [Nocardia sp. CDC153]|uniref:GAF and ANTAR domain-containing protein n=1 Tax=Nocardia sp. CDC153 TaxID=3112167 RepID=UPI002DBD4633|nr:GAF and ANTAR domain-containing protein [Nocardia sp. CDC153]MEC3954851.1 GAF and ANTAR domain-containing protein [Nocardia sp. CDC153]
MQREAADQTSPELAIGFSELTSRLLSIHDIAESASVLADVVSGMLPGQPMLGVLIRQRRDRIALASNDPRAASIEEIQYHGGHGPSPEALETGLPVSVPDVTLERRWEGFSAQVGAHDVRSIHSQPLVTEDATIGVLTLYARRPYEFGPHTHDTVALTATHTAVLLSAAFDYARQAETTEQLLSALASRSVIDQALGIVMGQRRCGRDQAFELLRQNSQRRNVKLATVAAEIIHTITGTAPAATHFETDRARQ